MFPLQRRIVVGKYGAWRFNTSKGFWRHWAVDYRANYEPLIMPFNGIISTYREYEGGLWINFENDEVKIRTAHNSRIYKTGFAYEGEIIGKTGNTGAITTVAHSHLEITSKLTGQKFNPEDFNWNLPHIINKEFMLIRNSRGEIAYLSPKGVKHPINAQAYEKWFDNGAFLNVTDEQYNQFPTGESILK